MRSWYISCLCATFAGAWLSYYCHDEPVVPHNHQRSIRKSYITPYRNLPTYVQKKICRHAEQAERLFFPDAQHYRLAIIRTFMSGGYLQRT